MSANHTDYEFEYEYEDDLNEELPFSEAELRLALIDAPKYLYATIELPSNLPFELGLEPNSLIRPLINISSISEELTENDSYRMKCDVTNNATGDSIENLDGYLHTLNVKPIIPRAVAHSIHAHTSEISGHAWIYENFYWAMYQPEYNRIQFAYPLAGTQVDINIPALSDLNAGYES